MIDLHSHILPDMDDGSDSWETSIEMCKMASDDGIEVIVATPHINELYPSNKENIHKNAELLNAKIDKNNQVQILTGADVHVSVSLLKKIKSGNIPTINNKNYILLEIPDNFIFHNLENIIFELRLQGLRPVLTHPERNFFLHDKPGVLRRLIENGVFFQITSMSLTGGFGKRAMRSAVQFLKRDLVHIIATDAHSLKKRPPVLSPGFKKAQKIAGDRVARMMVLDVPQKVIEGKEIDISEIKGKKRRFFFYK